jgi:hypothetical protein
MRRIALALGVVLLAAAVALGAAAAWLGTRDPLASLPKDDPAALEVTGERAEASHGRTLLHVALRGRAVGDVGFVVSLPDPMPSRRIPLVVIVDGLGGGADPVRAMSEVAGDAGPNAFVGYDWPLPAREPAHSEVVRRLPEYRRDVLSVPGQLDAILAWGTRQAWADPARVSLLGFSLGAFVVPAAQRIAAEHGVAIRWTALAYAGAPIGAVIAGNPHTPRWARPVIGAPVDLLLRPVEPSNHLPHLRGRFLVLGATSDRLIARAASERLAALTPEPRTIVWIEGVHMGLAPDKRELLARVVHLTRAWLVEQGAIDPSAPAPARAPAAPAAR